MNSDFKSVMSKRTDDELIKIVTVNRDGYQPLAVEAAEEEIKKRNINPTQIENIKSELSTKFEEQKDFESKQVSSLNRLIHFIVDTLIWLIIVFILTSPLNVNDDTELLIGYLILIASYFAYYIFMETKYQKTIGKFITKTKVVNKNGTKPNFGDIVKRTFCRFIPFDRFSFLFTKNGIHDNFSDTTVVKDEE